MTAPDLRLTGIALVELVARLGTATPLVEYLSISGGPHCPHETTALYLADVVTQISEQTGFDLQAYLDDERAECLDAEHPEPGGFA